MPRGNCSDSDDSILSHITVMERDSASPPPAVGMSTVSRSSEGASSLQSTPPTSLGGASDTMDTTKGDSKRRASRARSSLSTPASQNDSDSVSTKRPTSPGKTGVKSKTSSRNVSGATLVEATVKETREEKLKKELGIDMHFDMADEPQVEDNTDGVKRRASRRSQIGLAVGGASSAIAASASTLGKRARHGLEEVKEKVSAATTRTTRGQVPQSPPKKAKYEPTGRMFPNMRLGAYKEEITAETKAEPAKPKVSTRIEKLYQPRGLYAGQSREFDGKVKEGTNKKRSMKGIPDFEKENSVLPLPMFGTYKRLTLEDEKAFAPFKLPADVLLPLKKEQNPKDWSKLNKNRFIGDAAATWDMKAWQKIDPSYCLCEKECDDQCINRSMSYECNDKVCKLGEECGNRPFAELAFRYKNKNFSRLHDGEKPEGNLWGEGVETVRTEGRGYGVRAMRPFKPNQIVVEYCGEIITQEEGDRRMNQDYKDKKDYYLMDFHDGMIIDATRGSICRFVNHSCDPNCRVEKWMVNGEPRMALFAGEDGIMTDEELTYDYNFEVFSKNSQQECLCGSPNCRGVLGPKPKDRPSKAKQLAGAVKGAIQGVKRKVEQMINRDDEEDEPVIEKKRVKIANEVMSKVRRQLGSGREPRGTVEAIRHNEKRRQKRAAEKLARQQAKHEAAGEVEDEGRAEDDAEGGAEAEEAKPDKSETRFTSTTLAVSDLPRSNSRRSASPAKRMSSIKKRVEDGVKSVMSATTAPPRTTSQTPLLKPSTSFGYGRSKEKRQSRIGFGPAGFSFHMSPQKVVAAKDEDEAEEEASGGPVIPKRGSSLKATSNARPSTAKSVLKGVSKVASAARVGVQGDRAIRKTIRAVSGAAE